MLDLQGTTDLDWHQADGKLPGSLDLAHKAHQEHEYWFPLPIAPEVKFFFPVDHGQKRAFSGARPYKSVVGLDHRNAASCMGTNSHTPCCIQGSHQLMVLASLRSSSAWWMDTASALLLAWHVPLAGVVPSPADAGTCWLASEMLRVGCPPPRVGWPMPVPWGQQLPNDWLIQKSRSWAPSWHPDPSHPPCCWGNDDHRSSSAFLAHQTWFFPLL